MSVDYKAMCMFGWKVEKEDLPDSFEELEENDFSQLDEAAQAVADELNFGHLYGWDVVQPETAMWDPEFYVIGVECDLNGKDADGIAEWASGAEEAIAPLYEAVMGKAPADKPKFHLWTYVS